MHKITSMTNKKNNQITQELQRAEPFRQKASHYLVCFIENCLLRDDCLRYQVGQHANSEPLALTAVNPLHEGVAAADCPLYRPEHRVVVKFGLKHLYDDMPHRIEKTVRSRLIQLIGFRYYYEMRKGDRPITPDYQQIIADVRRQHGWQGPIVYDGEAEDWDW